MKFRSLVRLLSLCCLLGVASTVRGGVLEDRAIDNAIRSSFVFREILRNGEMVQLYIRHGNVELRGQVADEAERQLLVNAVRSIRGVDAVDNRLSVDSPERRLTDRWLAARIRAALLARAGVNAATLEVTVNQGAVVLSGTAATDAQRDLTEFHVRQVARVESLRNELVVAATPTTPADKNTLDDPSVTALVLCALRSVASARVVSGDVTSLAGHVVIRGSAGSDADIAAATQLVATVRGVKTVAHSLSVKN